MPTYDKQFNEVGDLFTTSFILAQGFCWNVQTKTTLYGKSENLAVVVVRKGDGKDIRSLDHICNTFSEEGKKLRSFEGEGWERG